MYTVTKIAEKVDLCNPKVLMMNVSMTAISNKYSLSLSTVILLVSHARYLTYLESNFLPSVSVPV